MGASLALTACSTTTPTFGPVAQPLRVVGDWNDLDVSVSFGASRAELAVLDVAQPSPGLRVYSLLSVGEEPGRLVARTGHPSPLRAAAPIEIELTASVGYFGDPRREAVLLRMTQRRLEQLAGVDYAPIR